MSESVRIDGLQGSTTLGTMPTCTSHPVGASPYVAQHRTSWRHVEGLTHTIGPERDGVERVPSFIGRMGQPSLGSI